MTQGTISYIGPLKSLGKSGKLKSVGIKLVEDPEEKWHNIKGFTPKDITDIKGDTQIGDFVELDETPNEWESENEAEPSVKAIKILKRGGEEGAIATQFYSQSVTATAAKEDLKAFMPEPSPVSLGAEKFVEECINLAIPIVEALKKREIFVNVMDVAEAIRETRIAWSIRR